MSFPSFFERMTICRLPPPGSTSPDAALASTSAHSPARDAALTSTSDDFAAWTSRINSCLAVSVFTARTIYFKIQEIAQIWNECLVVAALNMQIRLVRGDCSFINAETCHIRVCLNAFILRLHMFAHKQMHVLKFAYFLNQVGHMMYCGLVL